MNISQLDVEDKIIEIKNKKINEAVSRNPEKFPEGYLIELNENEKQVILYLNWLFPTISTLLRQRPVLK